MSLDLVTFTQAMNNIGAFSADCHLAIAASGGPDSMVLCHLTQKWLMETRPEARITALIVDHGLRPESTTEAQITQRRLQNMGINSEILTWKEVKPTTRIQEKARQARYALLESRCQDRGIIHLLTGHHFDDQWETVVSRLQKKSDTPGLRGILPVRYQSFGRIIRPLLRFSKQDILGYAVQHSIDYALDPSNQNPKYLRSFLRQNRQLLEQQDFSPGRIQELIQAAIITTHGRFVKLTQFIVESVRIDPLGYFELNRQLFQQLEQNLQVGFFKCLGQCMATTPYPLSRQKALTAIQEVLNGKRTTVAGWYLVPKKHTIIIAREPRATLATTRNMNEIRQDRFIMNTLGAPSLVGTNEIASYITSTLPQQQSFTLKFLTPLLQ